MPKMTENSPETQCRLCTSTTVGQIVEIFGENGRTRNLAKKIEECLPISVARGDVFPKSVCLTCLDKLEQFFDFRERCIKSELCFEAKWKELHPHQNIQFPLEPECCLQEMEAEPAPAVNFLPPAIRNHPTPEGLFRLEIIPQYNIPKKPDPGPNDFLTNPVLTNPFATMHHNHFKMSTPLVQPSARHARAVWSHATSSSGQGSARVGLPNPDDYILVKEETIAVGRDPTKSSNGRIEFDGGGPDESSKDLDIILEQKRRHTVLPPMWDVYEKIITVHVEGKCTSAETTPSQKREGSVVDCSGKHSGLVDNNENSITDQERHVATRENGTKDNVNDIEKDKGAVTQVGAEKNLDSVDAGTQERLEDPAKCVDVKEKSVLGADKERKYNKPTLKIIHRRYIISKEAFPCSLCGNCFFINQGYEREKFPSTLHNTSSFENDINLLNNTPEDRKMYNLGRLQQNQVLWPPVEISRKYAMPVVSITKNKPNIAFTTKNNGPINLDVLKRPLVVSKKVTPPLAMPVLAALPRFPSSLTITPKVPPSLTVTPRLPPAPVLKSLASITRQLTPEVTQTVVNTRHQFVSQLIKREPAPNEEGVSVTSEDIDDFNSLVIKNFYCEICNKYFPRRSSLKRHQRTHASDKVFCCPHCGKSFSRKEHLSRHMLLHTEIRPFQCKVCLKKYTRKEHVERHILIHPQPPEYRNRPEKMYHDLIAESRQYSLLGSKLGIFRGRGGTKLERPYVCELCNHGFARREHLQRHKKRMHRVLTGRADAGSVGGVEVEGAKPYTCQKCFKNFTRKEHLVRHNKIHLREAVLRTSHLQGLNLLPAMLQLPPKSMIHEIKPALSITRAPPDFNASQNPQLPCDRIPGLDVSLSVVDTNDPSKISAPKEIPLVPNKLDISISLVKDPQSKPSTSNGLTQAKTEATPQKLELPVAIPEKVPEDPSDNIPIPPPNINHLGSSEEHLMSFLKPFNCDFCFNKRFTRKSHLVRHFKRIHPDRDVGLVTGCPNELKSEPVEFDSDTFVSNSDEHLCKICNKNFSRRYHLNRHLKLHLLDKTGRTKELEDDSNKPFKCSSCNDRFAKYEGFQMHRCTGTEVGSMVLVSTAEMAGGSETGSTTSSLDTSLESRPTRSKDNVEGKRANAEDSKEKKEPTKSESAKSKLAMSEPAKSKLAMSEPAKSKLAMSEPAKSKPAMSEPAKSKPAMSEPVKSEPAKSKPAMSEPAKSEPAKSKLAMSEPAKSEPAKNEPAKNSPVAQPMAAKKIATKRSSTGGGAVVANTKNPAKRDKRKVSRNCYECEVCGANFALKKLVNKHMLTHDIDVANESDGGKRAGESKQ